MANTILTPPEHRGMTELDRDAFKATYTLWAIRLPSRLVKQCTTELEPVLLNIPRIRTVVSDPTDKSKKLILLSLGITDLQGELTAEQYKWVQNHETIHHSFDVNYDYWTTEQILYSVMPEGDADTPSSFTSTGHIAHVNLKQENTHFKNLIAQVILDKNKKITSVVNKTNNINNTYRNFEMEVLAGDTNMIAELRENECRFKFDFSKVYWNSRLQAEHGRLVGLFKKGELICDVMAGVGPFSIPAAKKGCLVYANDLNPASYEWLCENIKLNKLKDIEAHNMDGREFIKQSVAKLEKEGRYFNHFVMNLPATAIEFLDVFRSVYNKDSGTLPMIHVYCFTRSSDPLQDINQRIRDAMGQLPIDAALHFVRTVAPKKDMYCISFRLAPEK